MLRKGTKIYSIINNKCPKCNEGNFFEDNNLLHLKKVMKMNSNCPQCGFKYEIEPSFFYGAMYVSYALTVAFAIAIFVICHLLSLSLIATLIAIVISLVVLTPMTMRISRILYINMFVHYEKGVRSKE